MTTTRVPEVPLTPPSQGYVTFDAPSTAAATLAIGLQPSGQSVPLGSGPPPALHFSVPTKGTLEEQYQHLMETTQRLQGMALSVCPSSIPTGLEILVRPAPAYHAFATAPSPRPSSQLLTVPTMGARFPPPTAQHTALHTPPPPGGLSFGLVGAQYPTGLLSGTPPVQQLML